MSCPIYDLNNAQLLDVYTGFPQLPPRKVPEIFLVWVPG